MSINSLFKSKPPKCINIEIRHFDSLECRFKCFTIWINKLMFINMLHKNCKTLSDQDIIQLFGYNLNVSVISYDCVKYRELFMILCILIKLSVCRHKKLCQYFIVFVKSFKTFHLYSKNLIYNDIKISIEFLADSKSIVKFSKI